MLPKRDLVLMRDILDRSCVRPKKMRAAMSSCIMNGQGVALQLFKVWRTECGNIPERWQRQKGEAVGAVIDMQQHVLERIGAVLVRIGLLIAFELDVVVISSCDAEDAHCPDVLPIGSCRHAIGWHCRTVDDRKRNHPVRVELMG